VPRTARIRMRCGKVAAVGSDHMQNQLTLTTMEEVGERAQHSQDVCLRAPLSATGKSKAIASSRIPCRQASCGSIQRVSSATMTTRILHMLHLMG
jgi:hypothetical protein